MTLLPISPQHFLQIVQCIYLLHGLIFPPSQHTRKAYRHTAFVPTAGCYTFKAQLENKLWLYSTHRPKLLQYITLYKVIYLRKFLIG